MKKPNKNSAEKPLSLDPLGFKEAVKSLLKVERVQVPHKTPKRNASKKETISS